jgi:cytochrome c biogenesis protein CcmG/thiol:disulfide interchange protein DsbE
MTDTPPSPPPSRRRLRTVRAVTGVLLGLAVGVVVLAVVAAERPVTQDTTPSVPVGLQGAVAPGFSLPRLGGGAPVTLASYRGRPIVITFFAHDCQYCQEEVQAFAVASRQLAGKISFVAVDSVDSDPGAALALMRHAGDDYPAGADPDGRVAQSYLVVGLPESVFVNGLGRVVDVQTGAQTVSEIERWAAVAEAN